MSYTPPISGDITIDFNESGYTPPVSGALTLNFESVGYKPPISGSLTANFTESGYTPPVSDSLNINFILGSEAGYEPPVSGALNINFTESGYVPPVSGALTINFLLVPPIEYEPPVSGDLTINFTGGTGPDGGAYSAPESGSLTINFTESGYVAPTSGNLTANFEMILAYTPPLSGEAIFNFVNEDAGDGDITEVDIAFVSTGVLEISAGILISNSIEELFKYGGTSITFQTVVVDIANNYGFPGYIGCRSIEFTNGGSVNTIWPENHIDYTEGPETLAIENLFDTTVSKTGSASSTNTWRYDSGDSNIRLVMRLVDLMGCDGIIINNYHSSGLEASTSIGIKDVKITLTKDEVTDLSYNGNVPNGHVVFDGTVDRHVYSDVIDDQNLICYFPELILTYNELYDELSPMSAVFNEDYLFGERIGAFIEEWKSPLQNIFNEDYPFEAAWLKRNYIERYGQQVFFIKSEPYSDVPVIKKRFIEPYRKAYIPSKMLIESYSDVTIFAATFEENYADARTPTKFIEESYTDYFIFTNRFEESYGDNLVFTKKFDETYEDALVMKNVFAERYSDMYNIFKINNEDWKSPESVESIFDEKYSITSVKIITSFEEQYGIIDHNKVGKTFNEPYALLNSTAKYVTQETSITINGEYVEFADVSLSMSNAAYLISGSVNLLTESDYISSSLGDEIIVKSEGIPDIKLFIEAKSSSYEFGSISYQLSVLSPTAKLDVPYTRKITRSFTTDIYASDLVQQLADIEGIVVDYRLIDWLITANAISINNVSPISAIRTIVQSVGGIMQTAPDGTLIIMSKFPVPVSQLDTVVPDVSYDLDEDLLSIAPSTKLVDGYNAYIVYSETSSDHSITLREEEINESTKIIKGFRVPFSDGPFDLETSGGIDVTIEKDINPVTELIPIVEDDTDEEWETVEFIDFASSTSYPIYSVVEYEWLSRDLGEFSFEEGGTLTVINQDQEFGESLLRIKYNTKYWKWTVTCPNIKKVQFYVPEIED